MILLSYLAFLLVISLLFVYLERLSGLFVLLLLSLTLYFLAIASTPNIILIIIAMIFSGIWLSIYHHKTRLWLLNTFFYKTLIRTKVSISQTEQIAMESGQTYWDENLFSSKLDWSVLFAVDSQVLSQTEQDFINTEVPKLIKLFHQCGLSDKVLSHIKNTGFWSFNIPTQYGGLNFSAKAHATILSQISSCDVSLAVTVMVPNSLGPAELILRYGSDAQKQTLLPELASGKQVPCFALTSTDAGSDAGAMLDTGVVCYGQHNGVKTLGLRLNWKKRYTTLAPIATLIGLAFKTHDPDGLLGGKSSLGISCALVDANLAGVEIGRYHHPIGANFANGPHQGRDVFIPLSAVIGGQKMLGQGWRMLMESLSLGRGVSLPSLSIAGMQISLKTSIEYGFIRQQFRQNLCQFQGIAEQIVPMAADIFVSQAMSDFHLNLLDKGVNPSVGSAILKYHHTQALRTHINAAMDIQAGKAVMLGSGNYLANIYQTIPIAITVEGANILTRSMIIFGQGLLRCHPFLNDEVLALSGLEGDLASNKQNMAKFNQALGGHLQHLLSIKTKSFIYNLFPIIVKIPTTNISDVSRLYYQQLYGLSAGFAFLIEMSLVKYAQKLKFQESLTGLFSDVLIHLYALSTTLAFFEKNHHKEQKISTHQDLLVWIGQAKVHQIQQLFHQICAQFSLGFLFKIVVLPKGISPAPSVKLQGKIMHQLIHDTKLKQQLTNTVVLPDVDQPLAILEQAFELGLAKEKIYQRLSKTQAQKTAKALFDDQEINQDEFDLLSQLTRLTQQALQVDDYENKPSR